MLFSSAFGLFHTNFTASKHYKLFPSVKAYKSVQAGRNSVQFVNFRYVSGSLEPCTKLLKKKKHSETSELSLIKISHMKITKSPLPTHFESQGGKIPH